MVMEVIDKIKKRKELIENKRVNDERVWKQFISQSLACPLNDVPITLTPINETFNNTTIQGLEDLLSGVSFSIPNKSIKDSKYLLPHTPFANSSKIDNNELCESFIKHIKQSIIANENIIDESLMMNSDPLVNLVANKLLLIGSTRPTFSTQKVSPKEGDTWVL